MACKRSSVRSRLPPPHRLITVSSKVLTLSSRGLGHHPFTVSTGVRIPVGSPSFVALGSVALAAGQKSHRRGVVVQSVRIPACHAGGRGFESRPLRQYQKSRCKIICSGFFSVFSEFIATAKRYADIGRSSATWLNVYGSLPGMPHWATENLSIRINKSAKSYVVTY